MSVISFSVILHGIAPKPYNPNPAVYDIFVARWQCCTNLVSLLCPIKYAVDHKMSFLETFKNMFFYSKYHNL